MFDRKMPVYSCPDTLCSGRIASLIPGLKRIQLTMLTHRIDAGTLGNSPPSVLLIQNSLSQRTKQQPFQPPAFCNGGPHITYSVSFSIFCSGDYYVIVLADMLHTLTKANISRAWSGKRFRQSNATPYSDLFGEQHWTRCLSRKRRFDEKSTYFGVTSKANRSITIEATRHGVG